MEDVVFDSNGNEVDKEFDELDEESVKKEFEMENAPVETTEQKKKTQSRKFVVWLVWLIVSVALIVVALVTMLVTKSFPDNIVDLIKTVITYFFAISMMYLGMNVGQKIGLSFADKMKGTVESTVKENLK